MMRLDRPSTTGRKEDLVLKEVYYPRMSHRIYRDTQVDSESHKENPSPENTLREILIFRTFLFSNVSF